MITEKEQQATLLSPTKKDYYQIWNELMDTASKISARWDPTSTNESDPGIVLLKLLTAVADKLNYNIDKNILEAFMPSASQEESMRKLCEMMGYSMKYYRSATTDVTIAFNKSKSDEDFPANLNSITIPRFTNIQNIDEDVNYFTLQEVTIDLANKDIANKVTCMEGMLCICETENDNIIGLDSLDDDHRYYLPEYQIAENGIFVFNLTDGIVDPSAWVQVDNLNTRDPETKVYKFGIDYRTNLPYIQFTDDISAIIEDGLRIFYTRTNGANGNVSVGTLTKLSRPSLWDSDDASEELKNLDAEEDFTVTNVSATYSGADKESINEAYNNYKKVIGTFDTLVTCRDYANKIYQLTDSINDTTPLVSNAIVADIRDDLNRAITLCSFNEYGICYEEMSVKKESTRSAITTGGDIVTIKSTEDKIGSFDLVLYPFKTVYGSNTKREYDESFKYSTAAVPEIVSNLKDYKTVAHNYKTLDDDEIACIKNYLKLNAVITTVQKVTEAEEENILKNIYINIYKNFNLHKLDFGEEIPFDSILNCIYDADERIKNVSLNEPILYTVFETADGKEYDIAAVEHLKEKYKDDYDESSEQAGIAKANAKYAKGLYNKLALRNILAGKLAMFCYDTDFTYEYSEKRLNYTERNSTTPLGPVYPKDNQPPIVKLTSGCTVTLPDDADTNKNLGIILGPNEVIQFRSKSLKTTLTYPSYINYFAKLTGDQSAGVPATFITLYTFMENDAKWTSNDGILQYAKARGLLSEYTLTSEEQYNSALAKCKQLYKKTGENTFTKMTEYASGKAYGVELNDTTFAAWSEWIKAQKYNNIDVALNGLYKRGTTDLSKPVGKLVDETHHKYSLALVYTSTSSPFTYYYIQQTHSSEEAAEGTCTIDGLGKDAVLAGIPKNCEYRLKDGEYILFNYTETDDDGNSVSRNIAYKGSSTEDVIIKPNFELSDSTAKKDAGSAYTKTKGYDFSDYGITDPEGMFTTGASEQIEIRAAVNAIIGNEEITETAYVYWEVNDEKRNKTFFEDEEDSYILKDGEYFFYTDTNKLGLVYYGNGTEIKRNYETGVKFNLYKPDTTEDITVEELLELNISAIPWIALQVNSQKYLEISEYQYISLVEGDILEELHLTSNAITGKWQQITVNTDNNARYRFSGSTSNIESLPILSGDDELTWEVRSTLDINSSRATTQTLRHDSVFNDTITIYYAEGTSKTATPTILESKQETNAQKLSFKTNYFCQTASGEINAAVNALGEAVTNFKVKVFELAIPTIPGSDQNDSVEALPIGNFGEAHTAISFANAKLNEAYTTLNANIPTSNRFGLIMFNYTADDSSITIKQCPSIVVKDTNGTAVAMSSTTFSLYNRNNWWSDGIGTNSHYYLRNGINVIAFHAPCTIELYPGETEINNLSTITKGTLIFSDLNLIKTDKYSDGINIDLLQYNAIDKNSAGAQLLNDINTYDIEHNFYYNHTSEYSTRLNINTDAQENLATPYIYYDYNNMNNKFTISEISSDYLSTGIVISNSSKAK